MKAISISGGGENGAFTVGRLSELNKDYHIGDGTSTGSLMLMLVLLRKWEKLIEAYTSVGANDINEKSLFKGDNIKIGYAIYRFIYSFFGGPSSFGDSNNLLKTIQKFIDAEDWKQLHESGKRMYVSAYSYTYQENVSFDSYDFKDNFLMYLRKIWHSSNAPFVMSTAKDYRFPYSKVLEEWGDGGISDGHKSIYLNSDISRDITELDLFLHRDREYRSHRKDIKNIIDQSKRIINGMIMDNSNNDLELLKYKCQSREIVLNVHYIPNKYITGNNVMTFNNDKMKDLVKAGIDTAYDEKYIDRFEIIH